MRAVLPVLEQSAESVLWPRGERGRGKHTRRSPFEVEEVVSSHCGSVRLPFSLISSALLPRHIHPSLCLQLLLSPLAPQLSPCPLEVPFPLVESPVLFSCRPCLYWCNNQPRQLLASTHRTVPTPPWHACTPPFAQSISLPSTAPTLAESAGIKAPAFSYSSPSAAITSPTIHLGFQKVSHPPLLRGAVELAPRRPCNKGEGGVLTLNAFR